jgi:WD40 repeat protein
VEGQNGSGTGKVVHWISTDTGQEVRRLDDMAEPASPESADSQVGRVFLGPDGRWVAGQHFLGDGILLYLWDARTGQWEIIGPADQHCFCVDAAAFSSDGEYLVFTSGTDGGGTHWLEQMNLNTRRRLSPIEFPGYSVRHLAFASDARHLAAATYGGAFVFPLHRSPVPRDVPELKLEDADVEAITFRPRREELAILYGGEVLFWDGRATEADRLSVADDRLLSLGFSPDGQFLVLGCADHTVRLLDCETGRERQCFDWQIGPVSAVAFAPDGMTCAAGGAKGEIVIWDVSD